MKRWTRRILPGLPLAARELADLARGAGQLAGGWTAAPLSALRGPTGNLSRDGTVKPFPAKLSGSGNPYSFAQVYAATGGGWTALPHGITGTNAYEANDLDGLNNEVVTLYPSSANDFRFQWVGHNRPPLGYIGAIVRRCNSGQAPVGTTVDLIQGGVITAVTINSGGTGYSNSTFAVIAGDGTGVTSLAGAGVLRLTITGGVITAATFISGGIGYTSGKTFVVFENFGGGSGASITLTISPLTVVGTSTIQAGVIAALGLGSAGSGYTPGTGYALGISDGSGTGATATFNVGGTGHVSSITLTAGGSNYTAPTFSFSAAGAGTGATAAATLATMATLPFFVSGTYAAKVPSFQTWWYDTTSNTTTGGFAFTTYTVTMQPIPGWACCGNDCLDPIPNPAVFGFVTSPNLVVPVYLTDTNGTWQSTTSLSWIYTVSPVPIYPTTGAGCLASNTSSGTGTGTVQYGLTCPSTTAPTPHAWRLLQLTTSGGQAGGTRVWFDATVSASCFTSLSVFGTGSLAPNDCATFNPVFTFSFGIVQGTATVSF